MAVSYRIVFDRNPVPMWIHDRETLTMIDVNIGFLKGFGYDRAEFLQMKIGDIFLPNEIPPLFLDLKPLQQPRPFASRWRIRRRDGRSIPVDLSANPIRYKRRPCLVVAAIPLSGSETAEPKPPGSALPLSADGFLSIMDQASDGIFISDSQGNYIEVNPAGCGLLGYTREEILQRSIRDLVVADPADPLRFDELRSGKTLLTERRLRRKDGGTVLVEISGKMLEDGRLLGIVRDITARKQEEEKLRYISLIMAKLSSAVIVTDAQLQITQWNKAAEDLYGWQEGEALGRPIDEVCRTEFMGEGGREEAQKKLLAEKKWRGELKQRRRDGSELWVDASVALIEDEQGIFIGGVTINHDITERKMAEEELRRAKEAIEEINETLQSAFEREQIASRTDSLTGVFNRRYFFELIEYEFAASRRYRRPLSIVMFDIDLFKRINDTYGHQVGDEVLRHVARVVRNQLRESDVLSRYGGDEFVLLLPNSDEREAAAVLRRIHRKIRSSKYLVEGKSPIDVTISAGIASWQPGMESPTQLIRSADEALYSAKGAGRNRMAISAADEPAA
ncbi:MAG: hypothetical protein DPW18_15820 [Chloroflexi bacterium]|nr:hypothetical protein [Chloroflexota bacterium]MDL1940803.1 PAS domain S-box protein [Chloroflexi bacterium CFX2]